MNAIIIAPSIADSNLEFAPEELQRAINFLHPERVLMNSVTLRTIADQVADRTWDYVFVMGHGAAQGVQLSDGTHWTADEIIQTFKGREPKLLYFNTCDSLDIAVQAFESLGSSVIFTRVQVPDRQAFTTGVELARALAETGDVREAYERSRPVSSRNYILLNGTIRANASSSAGDLAKLILEANSDMVRRMSALDKRIDGLEQKLRGIENTLDQWVSLGPTYPRTNRVMWSVGFVLFSLVLIISSAEVIEHLQISVGAWVLLVIVLGGSSFIFLAAGLNFLPWRF